TLIVRGEADNLVPVEGSLVFHEALKKVGADVTLHTLPGAGHGWDWGGDQRHGVVVLQTYVEVVPSRVDSGDRELGADGEEIRVTECRDDGASPVAREPRGRNKE